MPFMNKILAYLPYFLFPAGVLAVHLVASGVFHLYTLYPNVDIPFHFVGGLSIAYTASRILGRLETDKTIAPLDRVVFLVLVVCVTVTAAVLWEFAEFSEDRLLGTNVQISLANTMQDQLMGLCGGMAWALVLAREARRAGRPF